MSEQPGIDKVALELFDRDGRFRAVAQSCVANAVRDFQRNHRGEEIRPQDVHDVALEAVVLLLKRVYYDDPEVDAMRRERDHYRTLAERTLQITPPRIFLGNAEGAAE